MLLELCLFLCFVTYMHALQDACHGMPNESGPLAVHGRMLDCMRASQMTEANCQMLCSSPMLPRCLYMTRGFMLASA